LKRNSAFSPAQKSPRHPPHVYDGDKSPAQKGPRHSYDGCDKTHTERPKTLYEVRARPEGGHKETKQELVFFFSKKTKKQKPKERQRGHR